jgi:hypothetical protein
MHCLLKRKENEPGVSFNLIGGTTAGAGNLVEFNGTGGIAIFGNPVSASGQPNIHNAIEGNSIFENGRSYLSASSAPLPLLGIDLTNQFPYPRDDGATPNDSKGHGAPSDPNNFQNFPVLTSATSNGVTTDIGGTLSSAPNSTQPTDDRESVILATLPPAAYTATLSGKGQTTGIGTVEIYDNDQEADSQLANISTRGFVQTGDNVMIGGFMLGLGSSNVRVAVRGLGPSLSQFGLSNLLADPTLELHDSNGATLASNDDWLSDPVSAGNLTANGLALPNSKESGIFTTLPPGAFTAILTGKNGGVGIGLVEIYNLH